MNKMLPYVKSDELEMGMEIAIGKIRFVRSYYGCPPFKRKDEVMIIEVPSKGDNVKAIDPEKLETWQGDFLRMLPIRPEDQFREHPKGLGGFLNYNGDEREAVEFVTKKSGGQYD